ncbi:hypothetical protein CCHR01_16597 [Colletotrichum chrysophilum]|uniref:Uncharacterized protein n=1 Tax=Colletotrichum chrysophilum TaxID=1836956 RepID=A0AAD9E7N3_9PEZI|nr:hypothetical protein CCHR01_16597 [Colletotrichum chrysophilum]
MCWSVVSGSLLPLLMLVVVFPSFVPMDGAGVDRLRIPRRRVGCGIPTQIEGAVAMVIFAFLLGLFFFPLLVEKGVTAQKRARWRELD